jgi:hypothetical protein
MSKTAELRVKRDRMIIGRNEESNFATQQYEFFTRFAVSGAVSQEASTRIATGRYRG